MRSGAILSPDAADADRPLSKLSLCAHHRGRPHHLRRRRRRKLVKPEERDTATAAKARTLAQALKALWPRAETSIDYRWSGTCDTTDDGLPLIGPVNGAPRLCAAYGYGGNGITFSYLAARLIATCIAGSTSPLLDDFAIGRDPP